MKKLLAGVAVLGVLGAGGYGWISHQSSVAIAALTNKNVNLGAVAAASAGQSCAPEAAYRRLVCLADALSKAVSPNILAKLQLPYSVENAKRWSNFPPAGYSNRIGPTLGEFTLEQLAIVKALLKEAAGIAANEGYDELEQVLNADDYLKENTNDTAGFSSGNYYIAFLGVPAATGLWQLYFGGHHFAFANTYKDGVLTGATPSFRGVEPFTPFKQNGRDNAPMAQEQAALATLLGSLTADQAAKARLSQTFTDILVGPQKDGTFPATREGVRSGDMSDQQQALVIAVVETYVRDISPAEADVILARYKDELAETFISYAGSTKVDAENDYIRIDGPSVWIEFSMQPGRSLPGIHPHSVWRDRVSDYGGNK
jgi:hypothetical protein